MVLQFVKICYLGCHCTHCTMCMVVAYFRYYSLIPVLKVSMEILHFYPGLREVIILIIN